MRSRKRVAEHGEVFTPRWLVGDMLDLVASETERIDSRFLEPACGSGNFLEPVLERKLASVESRYGKSSFEKSNYALHALMCIYGIELLADNVLECRTRLLGVLASFLSIHDDDPLWRAAENVLDVNIVQGDALSMVDASENHITFAEWGYLGGGRFQRRDFRFDDLTQRSAADVGLFTHLDEQDVFVPVRTFPVMTVQELAA